MKRLLLLPAIAMLFGFAACDDTATTIGSSIAEDEITIVVDSSYTITGHTVPIGAVQSRTLTQLIGRFDAPEFGKLASSVVTQFMSATVIDTVGITKADIDSIKFVMTMGKTDFTGDSVVPMGINVYRLNKQLPSPIYSDFSPADYYNPDQLLGSALYAPSAIGQPDSVAALKTRSIEVKMPHSLAEEIFDAYKENSANFSNPQAFVENVFPGVYVSNSYGSGRICRISKTTMQMYYHRTYKKDGTDKDTTVYRVGTYMAVTPEVVTNNNIHLELSDNLKKRIDDGENLIVAPAGMEVEFKFPAEELISNYRAQKGQTSVINTVTMSIPADTLANPDGVVAPPYVLLVLANKKDEFFANNQLPDNKTSFYASYDSSTGSYHFNFMRSFLLTLMDKEEITPEDVTFRLCPVDVSFETAGSSYWDYSTTESALVPYISKPAMVRLSLDKAKIKFTFSNQNF